MSPSSIISSVNGSDRLSLQRAIPPVLDLPAGSRRGLGFSRLIRHPEEKDKVVKIALGWFLAIIGATALYLLLLLLRLGYQGLDAEHLPVRLFLPAALALPETYRGSRILIILLMVVIAGDFWGHVRNNSYTILGIEPDSIRKAEAFHTRVTTMPGEPGRRLPTPPSLWYMNTQQVTKIPAVAGYVTMKTKGFDEVLCRSDFVEVLMSSIRFWLSLWRPLVGLSLASLLASLAGGIFLITRQMGKVQPQENS